MLKNNKEREAYFSNRDNWDCLGTIPVRMEGCLHSSDLLYVKKLKDYNIICIYVNMSDSYQGEHDVKLGYYESDGDFFNQIYQLSFNQCIDVMRKKDQIMKEIKLRLYDHQ